jgi:hypothetical protein
MIQLVGELIAGKWYVCDTNPPLDGRQTPGAEFAGPFDNSIEAQKWLFSHPECQGLRGSIFRVEEKRNRTTIR